MSGLTVYLFWNSPAPQSGDSGIRNILIKLDKAMSKHKVIWAELVVMLERPQEAISNCSLRV